jgi:hypothetical protein
MRLVIFEQGAIYTNMLANSASHPARQFMRPRISRTDRLSAKGGLYDR